MVWFLKFVYVLDDLGDEIFVDTDTKVKVMKIFFTLNYIDVQHFLDVQGKFVRQRRVLDPVKNKCMAAILMSIDVDNKMTGKTRVVHAKNGEFVGVSIGTNGVPALAKILVQNCRDEMAEIGSGRPFDEPFVVLLE